MKPDVVINDEGDMLLVHFISPRAIDWAEENTSDEESDWYNGALGIEHKYFEYLMLGLTIANLRVMEKE